MARGVLKLAVAPTGERAGGGQEPRVPTHHDVDLDSRERNIVHEVGHARHRDEAGGGGEPRRVVVLDEIIVDGLGNMEAAQVIVVGNGFGADDPARIAAVVAADVEKIACVVTLARVEHAVAIRVVGFVAR